MGEQLQEEFFEFRSIRIRPSRIVFQRDVTTEVQHQKFTIQNVGKNSVLIRITPSPCQFFTLQPSVPRGENLPPGLSLKKTLIFTHGSGVPHTSLLPIYVNEERGEYPILRLSRVSIISMTPKELHFGIVDCGAIERFIKISITNEGSKMAVFNVDVSRVNKTINAEPVKGHIKPGYTIEVSFQVVSCKPTTIDSTIKIKCDGVSTIIPITATVIITKLEAVHRNATESFTLIDFPPTYYGLRNTQILLVNNISSKMKMFSLKAELRNNLIDVDDYKVENLDYNCFEVRPDSGVFLPKETKIFVITFSPKKIPNKDVNQCYFATVLIKAVRCTDLDLCYDDIFKSPDCLAVTQTDSQGTCMSLTSNPSVTSLRRTQSSILKVSSNVLASLPSFQDRIEIADYWRFLKDEDNDLVRLHLYGTVETPSIHIVPNELLIKGMKANDRETRVLEIQNMSAKLPLYVHCKKIPFVHIDPETIYLNPSESIQISVIVSPRNIGVLNEVLVFEMMYHDIPKEEEELKLLGEFKVRITFEVVSQTKQPKCIVNTGLTPNYIKDVGKHCQNLKFNSILKGKPKAITVNYCKQIDPNSEDLVALPNDTQRSLRPWRSANPCKTIFTKNPRYSAPLDKTYELSELERQYKDSIIAYYNSCIKRRTLEESGLKLSDEYSLTKKNKVLLKGFNCQDAQVVEKREKCYPKFYLSLNPLQANKIIVWPAAIRTGQVATNHEYGFTLTITNTNDFDVRVIMRSDQSNLNYTGGNRHVVKTNATITVNLVYKTFFAGYYISNLDLILNESMALTVPIFAYVAPKAIHLDAQDVVFENNVTAKYINLINNLNVSICFTWVIVNDNFCVEPHTGSVHPGSKLSCVVRFASDVVGPTETEATLHSGDSSTKKIKFIAKVKSINLKLITEKVVFKNVPLNRSVMQKAIVKNPSVHALAFSIDDEEVSDVISVYPLAGIIPPLCQYAILLFTQNIVNCIDFSYDLKIHTSRAGDITLQISGNVVFPTIEIRPSSLKLEKIPAYTRTSAEIKVKNESPAPATVKFDMSENYQTYEIRESSKWDSNQVSELYLLSSQTQSIYIHFQPESALAYNFYLPTIINRILGPPLLSDIISTKTNYYLTKSYQGCTYPKVSPTIACCKIQSLATLAKFVISSIHVKLVTDVIQNTTQYNLSIKSRQSTTDNMFIPTSRLIHPLYIKDKVRGELESYCYQFEPGEEIELIISFKPNKTEFGKYKCALPIYVHSAEELYTYILIEATHKKPKISVSENQETEMMVLPEQLEIDNNYIFYFKTIPAVPIATFSKLIVHLNGHLECCEMKVESDITMMEFNLSHVKKQISEHYYTTTVTLGTKQTGTTEIDGYWKISCTCGGEWRQRIVGTFESGALTTYIFMETYWGKLIKYDKDGKLLPPTLDSSVDYTHFCPLYSLITNHDNPLHLSSVNAINTLNTWTKTQLFYGEMYYQLPSGLSFTDFTPPPEISVKRKTRVCSIPFAQILITLVGQEMYDYLGLVPDEEIHEDNHIPYLMSVYQNGLDFLKERGANISYIRPEYLLDYYNFLKYKETMYNYAEKPRTLTFAATDVWSFHKLAKISWIDVLLQFFNVLCMQRIQTTFYKKRIGTNPPGDFEEFSVNNHVQKLPGVLSETESLLLSWLEFHFNRNKGVIFKNSLPDRSVLLYGDTLADGLVYAVVTATYCPYLIPFLQNVCVDSCSRVECIHNYNIIIQCWEKLNYSFHMKSVELIQTNSIRTIMFTAYLFEVLPSMYPTETLVLKAPLSNESATRKIVLSNVNDFPIAYIAMFIGNEKQCFSTNCNSIVIPSRSSKGFVVKYFARFAERITCTLLLSGEVTGYKYARNKCVYLEGDPDLSQASSTITYAIDLYDVKNVTFTIQSPYKTAALYNVEKKCDPVVEPLELTNVVYQYNNQKVDAGRFILSDEEHSFNSDGVGVISGIIVAVQNVKITTWLFFKNPDVGDFSVKVITVVRASKTYETLIVPVSKKCEYLMVEIPYKNQLFLDCMQNLLLKITKDKEYNFWKRVIGTQMGVDIITRLYEFTLPAGLNKPIHCHGDVYEIKVLDDTNVVLPRRVEFLAECGTGSTKIPLKFKDRKAPLREFRMDLTSTKFKRKRIYLVKFHVDKKTSAVTFDKQK